MACGLLLVSDISNPTHLAPSDSFARQHVARSALEDAYAAAQQRVHQLQHHPEGWGYAGCTVECIETHISWLLLVGEHVYKFKKPLALDFLDFSTAALRLAACQEELRINRRTAPHMYLDVVGVVGDGSDSRPWRVKPWAAGDAAGVEPAVLMRRFEQQALLSRRLEAGCVADEDMDALAEQVARLHTQAAVANTEQLGGALAAPSPEHAATAPVRECLAALALVLPEVAPGQVGDLERLEQWCAAQQHALQGVWAQRWRGGHVRECHGDLHLANIAWIDGQPQLFDALEFNPDLRWIDCMADLAFLAMDLQARGRPDLAWRCVNRWLEHTGDYEALQVLGYYRVYRALVRARVAGLQWTQLQAQRTDVASQAAHAALTDQAQRTLQRYLALAVELTQPNAVALWLAYGLSGSGKSTHSLPLVAQRGAVRLRADVERKRLFGLRAGQRSDGVQGGIYTPQASRQTHERLAQLAVLVLKAGYPVLVDATFLNPATRTQFMALARALQVPCRILAFEAPLAVLRERVQARQRQGEDASEADVAVLDSQWAHLQPLAPDELALTVHVDTTQPVDWDALLPRSC